MPGPTVLLLGRTVTESQVRALLTTVGGRGASRLLRDLDAAPLFFADRSRSLPNGQAAPSTIGSCAAPGYGIGRALTTGDDEALFRAVADFTAGLGDYPAPVRCAANPGPVEPAAPAADSADRPSITNAATTGEGVQPSSTSPAFLPLIRPGTGRPYLPASVRPGGSEDRDGAASDYDGCDEGEEGRTDA